MFVTVQLESELERNAILVPDTAVLRSGDNNTVFVALDGGRFEPRSVALGERSEGNFYQVLSGLKEGERVVTSGEFMELIVYPAIFFLWKAKRLSEKK